MRVLRGRRRARARAVRGRRTARARDASRSRSSSRVAPGDALLVHAGIALGDAAAERRAMRFVDEFRDAELGRALAGEILADGRAGPPLQGHGGVRRPHALDLQVRRRRPAARERRARARPRLPGVRDPDGPRRRRHRDRPRAGRDLHLLRRHDARPRLATARCSTPRPQGADVRMVYSPLDALRIAKANPDREVVFFAIGFETTAPSTALTLKRAKAEGVDELLLHVQPRDDRAAAARAARVARPAARRLHRPRPRLDRRRRAAVRVHPGRLRQAGRRSRASSRSTSCRRST